MCIRNILYVSIFFLQEYNTVNQISEIICLAVKKKLWSNILFILKNSQHKSHVSKPAQSYGMDKCLQRHYHVCQNYIHVHLVIFQMTKKNNLLKIKMFIYSCILARISFKRCLLFKFIFIILIFTIHFIKTFCSDF